MPDGSFSQLGQDWVCDREGCETEIPLGHIGYNFTHGPERGECHCLACALSEDAPDAEQRLLYWKRVNPELRRRFEALIA